MRHVVEVKMPRIFGKKKKVEEETEIRTEVDLDENIKTIEIPQPIFVGGLILAGLTVGYIAGYKHGVEKGSKIIVIK